MIKLKITLEQIESLDKRMEKHSEKPGPLMPTLHDAQKIIGCIPNEIQELISNKLKVPIAKINGVVTFYAQFSLVPKGKNVVGVCLGTACYVKGAQAILDKVGSTLKIKSGETSEDGEFTLEATRCIGACGLAPVMSINEEVYGKLNVSKTIEALKEHEGVTLND